MGIRLVSTRTAALSLACVVPLATVGCAGGARSVVTAPQSREPALPTQRAVPVDKVHPQLPAGVVHVVSAGQTLYSIARTYGRTVGELSVANGLDDPDRLEVGQPIFVPGARSVLEVPKPSPRTAVTGKRHLLWPVAGGSILSHFGAPRGDHRHEGLDIRGRHGQPVVAVETGRVVYSGDTMRGYGKTIIVDHGRGMQSLYAHNSKLLVRKGERVRRGQAVARLGRSGNASTEHCHLEIRQNDVPRDPLLFVASRAGRNP